MVKAAPLLCIYLILLQRKLYSMVNMAAHSFRSKDKSQVKSLNQSVKPHVIY